MKSFIGFFLIPSSVALLLISCEGPMGPMGQDANETCKECHNQDVVDAKNVEFAFSKHEFGEAAFEEAGNAACTPCHTSEAFRYVSKNSTPATFTLNSSGKYVNDYQSIPASTLGELNCFTCHDKLHTTYTGEDFYPLTSTAPVALTMWKGAKTIDLTQDESMSNLCVKCHQPRPLTTSSTLSNGDVVDYESLKTNPGAIYYDNTVGNAAPNKVIPSYRTHVHYGTVGAIFSGVGGIEFTGSVAYTSSAHTSGASCADCHMGPIVGRAGGHTFTARGNLTTCNTAGCHTGVTTGGANYAAYWTNPRNEIKTLLNTLATKINAVGGGTDILHSDADTENNLWAGLTNNNYDGYLNIYDPSTNPTGVWRNPAPANSWTNDQKVTNLALPVFPSLKNATIGAMVNFQLALRDYSLGIHNFKYTKALLQNTIETMTAQGY